MHNACVYMYVISQARMLAIYTNSLHYIKYLINIIMLHIRHLTNTITLFIPYFTSIIILYNTYNILQIPLHYVHYVLVRYNAYDKIPSYAHAIS